MTNTCREGPIEHAPPGLQIEVVDGVARVLLDRAPVNALSAELYVSLTNTLGRLAEHDEISCIVLGSALGDPFCAGADLKEIRANGDDNAVVERRAALARTLFSTVLHLPVPTVALVTGRALGAGCVLASVCDIRVASPAAVFRLPEIDVGLLGGARHLLRLLPSGQARLMSFTGRPLSGDEAYRLGLVDLRGEDGDEACALAKDIADEIASKGPRTVRLAKQAVDESDELPVELGYRIEQHYTCRLRSSLADNHTAVPTRAAPEEQS